MIRLHDSGTLREFTNADAVIAHFALTRLIAEDLACAQASSDAGWPLHVAIDPCVEELRGNRILLMEASADELRREYRLRCQDI